jgi:hypothetical protein
MILELADIRIKPGQQAEFEKAIELGLATVISRAQGFQGAKVNHGIESPDRYVLQRLDFASLLCSRSGALLWDLSFWRRLRLNTLS